MSSTRRLLVALVVVATPSLAHAGRSRFGWLYGTEINPERGVEVESWIVEVNKQGPGKTDETDFWWGPVIALTPHLEIAIPVESEYHNDHDGTAPSTQVVRFGGEVRYRPQSPDRIDAGPLANLFRFGVKRMIDNRSGIRTELDVVTSYECGSVFALVDLGVIDEHVPGVDVFEIHSGAGVSVRLADGWRVGGETYGEITMTGDGVSWAVIGPTVGLTAGRFWGAATLGVGMFGVRDAGRITFGLAL